MSLTHGNLTLLTSATVIAALQFVPHWYPSVGRGGSLYYLLLILVAACVLIIDTCIYCYSWPLTRPGGGKRWRDRLQLLTCIAIVVAGLTFANHSYARGLPSGSYLLEFDGQLWRQPSSSSCDSGDITVRQKMVGYAIDAVTANPTHEAVIEMLGPIDEAGYFSASGRDLIYCLGPERGFMSIDDEWLLIWFDTKGQATAARCELWTD
jgi:hypothetical protein